MLVDDGKNEFDAEPDRVGNNDHWQHLPRTKKHEVEERHLVGNAQRLVMLQADIPHAK